MVHSETTQINDLFETFVAKFRLTNVQVTNLKLVKERAKNPEALQGIMLQESGAGLNTRSSGGCHGPFQIKTSTAVGFLKGNDEVRTLYFGNSNPTPKLVASKLKNDVLFSIDVADGLYAGSLERSKDHNRALMAYNQGERRMMIERNPTRFKYVREVSAKIQNIIKPFNAALAQPAPPADMVTTLETIKEVLF
jgi:hypothetical protein